MVKTFLPWTEVYSVKNEEIDNQHKRLINMLNKLYNAYMEKAPYNKLKEIIDELVEYTDYHFSTEEKLFKEKGFKQAESHIEQHENFKKQVIQFQEDFAAKKTTLNMKLITFLGDWIRKHILGSDQEYVSLLKD